MSKPLTYFTHGGQVRRRIFVDDQDPYKFTQQTTQVLPERLAEQNRALGELTSLQSPVRVLARGVPLVVYEQSVREQWDEARWTRWLEDPDNAMFRVSREKL